MDWNKVSALGTLGCLIVAAATLVFQVRPLPWGNQEEVHATKPKRPTKSALIVISIFIIIGFVLSGLSIWSAWHPADFEGPQEFGTGNVKMSDLERVEGRVFVNEAVEIDGKDFVNCTFENVKLIFHGKKTGAFRYDVFKNSITLETDNGAIDATLEILGAFHMLAIDESGEDDKHNVYVVKKFYKPTPTPNQIPTVNQPTDGKPKPQDQPR